MNSASDCWHHIDLTQSVFFDHISRAIDLVCLCPPQGYRLKIHLIVSVKACFSVLNVYVLCQDTPCSPYLYTVFNKGLNPSRPVGSTMPRLPNCLLPNLERNESHFSGVCFIKVGIHLEVRNSQSGRLFQCEGYRRCRKTSVSQGWL